MEPDEFKPLRPEDLVKGVYYTTKSNHKPHSITYTISKKNIMGFVGKLHEAQLDLVDEAVLKSDMKESKEVLKYIMEKK